MFVLTTACYKPISCNVDDDDILIFGNQGGAGGGGVSSHYQHDESSSHHQSHTRRTGSIPNLYYVNPVVQAAPVVRRFVKTTMTTGMPMFNQQQQQNQQQSFTHTSNTNLNQETAQISNIQSKFDEIFGVQRQNECYSSHSLGIDAPKTER